MPLRKIIKTIIKNLFSTIEYRIMDCDVLDDIWYEVEYKGIFGWRAYKKDDIDTLGFYHGRSPLRFSSRADAEKFIASMTVARKEAI